MAFSAARGPVAARWAGVPALIVGLAGVLAAPAAAAGPPGGVPPAGPPHAQAAGLAEPAFPAGPWRPAGGSGGWEPLRAARAGDSWSRLPGPDAGPAPPGSPWRLRPSPNLVVPNAMLVADSCTGAGACIAVGGYENRSGIQVALAEARARAGWRIQALPARAGALLTNLFGVSCTAADACTAVGYYVNGARQTRPLAERWNGTSWSMQAVPSPAGRPVAGFFAVSCASARACTAVGAVSGGNGGTTPLAERWNGTAWSIQPVSAAAGSQAGELLAVSCPAAAACTAAGNETDGAQTTVPLADRWNGTAWSVQAVPGPAGAAGSGFSGVSCSSPAACMAVGRYRNRSGATLPLAEAWNGSTWSVRATPAPGSTGGEFLAVSCSAAAACTAVGATRISSAASGGGNRTGSLAEQWNGTGWRAQATPGVGRSIGTRWAAVSCSAAAACTAAGSYDTTSRLARATAAAWDGRAWHRQAAPSPAGASVSSGLVGVSCASARSCTAAGFGTDTAGESTALAERWDGGSWRIQPVPVPAGAVSATFEGVSCPAPGACTAVGEYDNAGQRELALAERWSGGRWAVQVLPRLPRAAHGSQLAGVSCPSAASCFASGWSTTASGTVGFAAAWNGSRWRVQAVPGPAGSGQLLGVSCASPAACVAVGNRGTEVWNGIGWRYVAMATPAGAEGTALNGVSCTSASFCTAVGRYFATTAGPLALAETWNGTAWRVRPSPSPVAAGRNQLNTVSCTSPSACTAVGVDAASDFAPPGAFAEDWDGTRWRLEPVPGPAGAVLTELFGVSCPAAAACTAAGTAAGPSDIMVTLAMATAGA